MTPTPAAAPGIDRRRELSCDILVVGGGTAGTMAALSGAEHGASVLLMEKAHVRHSGALAMGMDGVNNAVIPGKATPEDYVAEITRANDGVVNQRTIYQTATRGYAMVQRLERYGVKFDKDEYGEYNVRKVHRSGSYVLPMPEGKDIKKVLYRQLRRKEMREHITIENRVMPVRVLVDGGRAVGAVGFDTRTAEFVTIRAAAVILATGACGRLGLPASGYLYGTYENPTNAGDGYAMAYHAGAELSGIECFQINPLIKDYNGPACAYVANPFGGYQVNNHGERFVDCDYWSGQMMAEVANEIDSARGPIYLKLTHLPDESISALKGILHSTERPTRGTFHENRGHDYRTHDVEMHISEIGLCSGHSASGVWVDEHGATSVPGLYAAGDLACVPHNYMIGAFVFGELSATHASEWIKDQPQLDADLPEDQVRSAYELIYRPLRNPDGPPQPQVEYKLRRFVNDYVAPPKTEPKLRIALESFARMEEEIAQMGAHTAHDLMRCAEVTFIRDCAEMAARSSLVRTESRWGLYHQRLDAAERQDADWLCHLNLRRRPDGTMEFVRRPVAPYVVPVPEFDVPRPTDVEVLAGLFDETPQHDVRADSATQTDPRAAGSARILELLELAEQEPDLPALQPFLDDDEVGVRRAAVATLVETAPTGVGPALVARMQDADEVVRASAAAGLRELAEVLPATDELRADIEDGLTTDDAAVRVSCLYVLRALRLGRRDHFATALLDADVAVRVEAVRGLVSLNERNLVATATTDHDREVRIAAAKGLGSVGDPASAGTLYKLSDDDDPLVRAAVFEAAALLKCPPPLDDEARLALSDPAWQVRKGAAEALGAADATLAIRPLVKAATDPHLDVRKTAVQSLAQWADQPVVARGLRTALDDVDADVRAYARMAVE